MKRKILISALLLLTVLVTHAQDLDIKPSQQAQGILESKNGMVDHATGLFHYKVPLYEIKSGNFTLPISLNYVAKGVKKDEPMGLMWYNWTLNFGGVVSRSIRGDIADEDPQKGILYNNIKNSFTQNHVDPVNKRRLDGESDIFTVAFNGKSVNFIISLDNSNNIVAIPLEKTNIKITCNFNLKKEIIGWDIVDDNGDFYIFNKQELSIDVNREIGSNNLYDGSFISSWYLSKIVPINGSEINFYYADDYNKNGNESKNFNHQNIRNTVYSNYIYGKNYAHYPLNFEKYEYSFMKKLDEALDIIYFNANQYIDEFTFVRLALSMGIDRNIIISHLQEMRNDFLKQAHSILYNARATNKNIFYIANILTILIDEIDDPTIFFSLVEAKNILRDYLQEHTNSTLRANVKNIFTQTIKTPILSRIVSDNNILDINYDINYRLNKITKKTKDNSILGVISISKDNISYKDKNGITYNKISFEYYYGSDEYYDVWGYTSERDVDFSYENSPNKYLANVNGQLAKSNSLKSILMNSGAKILIDYESNQAEKIQGSTASNYDYGGIRIKEIEINDNGSSSKINYKYPELGKSVYSSCYIADTIKYNGFEDKMYNSYVSYNGNAFLNTGNNSLYYPYVIEELDGKGSIAYLFTITEINSTDDEYPFWMNGIPLAKAIYNKNGALEKIIKNVYYANTSYVKQSDQQYFSASPAFASHSSRVNQIKPYKYSFDEKEIERRYYIDSIDYQSLIGYDPFHDMLVTNINPRSTVETPAIQNYDIIYGGKVLIKEQLEYEFENSTSGNPSKSDFNIASNIQPKNRIEYIYDDNSLYPTRIKQLSSSGNENLKIVKYLSNLNNATDLIILKLKEKNMFSTVISEQSLVRKSNENSYKLEKDIVYKYEEKTFNDKTYIVLSDIYSFLPNLGYNGNNSINTNSIYEYPSVNYLLEKKIEHKLFDNMILPCNVKETGALSSVDYGALGNIIFKSNTHNSGEYTSFDYMQTGFMELYDNILYYKSLYNSVHQFYSNYSKLDSTAFYSGLKSYVNSSDFKNILKLSEIFLNPLFSDGYDNFLVVANSSVSASITEELYSIFNTNYQCIYNQLPTFSINIITSFIENLPKLKSVSAKLFYTLPLTQTDRNIFENKEMKSIDSSREYCLYSIMNNSSIRTVSFIIYHSNGTTSRKDIQVAPSGQYRLNITNIDFKEYSDISSISVYDDNMKDVCYLSLVPRNCEFEATSYNTDGTVFCKFNQNGQLERYEYDAAGRVVKVYDNDNNVIKEFKYNTVL